MNNIFLDTNIVLDILIKDRTNHIYITPLLKKLSDYEVYISEDMLSTIYYITKDKTKTLEFFKFIKDEWNIVHFGKSVVEDAVNFSLKNSTDLEDTLQCFCAKEYGCLLITSDKNFIDCDIKIVDYDKFLGE